MKQKLLDPINKAHCAFAKKYYNKRENNYDLYNSDSYLILKCKKPGCIFRYWLKYVEVNGKKTEKLYIYRLINSNHSLPEH